MVFVADPLAGKLRDLLFESFTEDELAWLCGSIGEEYGQLAGEGKFGKTRELVRAAAARGQVRLLAARARDLKPELTDALVAVSTAAPSLAGSRPLRLTSAAAFRALAIVAVTGLLGAWVLLSGPLSPSPAPAPSATGATPSPATRASDVPVVTLAPILASPSVVPPTPAPVETSPPAVVTVAAPSSPTITPTADPPPTPGALAGPDPARTVREMNAQLIDFYMARVDGAALEQFWREGPRKSVLDFADSPLLKLLDLTAQTRSNALNVRMQYAREPVALQTSASSAVVQAREYWRYANTTSGRVLCETRDYTYRLILEAGRYRVESFEGQLLDSRCAD